MKTRVPGYASNWWLRSPNDNNSNNARYVGDDGNVSNNNVDNSNYGVRPDLLAEGLGLGFSVFLNRRLERAEQSKGTSFLAVTTANLAILIEHASCLSESRNREDGPFLL